MAEKIVITSGKGGVGKTSVAAFLGVALAELGERVVVLDLDFGLNNLDVVMGVEDKIVYDISDVVEGRCRAKQALVQKLPNLFMMPSSHSFLKTLTGQNVKLLIEGLSSAFDYILLDSPAGIDVGFHRAVSASDSAIIVVNQSLSSLRDADKVTSILKNYKLKNVYAAVNMVRGDLTARGEALSPEEIEEVLKLPLIAAIPKDDRVLLSSTGTLAYGSRAQKAFKIFAKNLIKKQKKLYDCVKPYRGIFGGVRRRKAME